MRHCELCGAPLLSNEGLCPDCGTRYTAEGLSGDLLMEHPQWGALRFDLDELKNRDELLSLVGYMWAELESNTSQGLFAGQLARVPAVSGRFTLYGPRESFTRIVEGMKGLIGSNEVVVFLPMSQDEIYRIRADQARPKGGEGAATP